MLALLALVGGSVISPLAPPASPGNAARPAPRVDGLLVTIVTPSPVVDPSVPFTLEATVAGGLPPFEYLWTSPLLGSNRSANWTVELRGGEATNVTVEVADAASEWGIANLSVSAGPVLALTASAPTAPVDLGEIVAVNVTVKGGVAPYTLQWSAPGDGESGRTPLAGAGTVAVPVAANGTGPAYVAVDLTDAVGGEATAIAALPTTFPLPVVTATAIPSAAEVGQPFHLAAEVLGGAPPVAWTVSALGPVTPVSPTAGVLDGGGGIAWTGRVAAPGNLTVAIDAVDARGSVATATVLVPVVAPVSSTLATGGSVASNGSTLLFSGRVVGGSPPYRFAFSLSDGESATGNLTAAGPVNWTAFPARGGYLVASLGVTDALGYSTESSLTVRVGPAASVAPPAPDPGSGTGSGSIGAWGAGLLLVGAAGYGTFRFLRARRPPSTASEAGEYAVLRELTSAPGGIDRGSLEALAAPRGIGPDRLTALVEEATRRGRVVLWSLPEGDRLRWVDDPPSEDEGLDGPGPSTGG